MNRQAGFRENVRAARQQLAEGRAKLKARHQRGSPGIQVCRALTDLVDENVLALYRAALDDLKLARLEEHVALVAHGGYGRRDLAPYSDVDLMILHAPSAAGRIAPLAERMLRDLFDSGLTLGQSVRTPQQACQLARKDSTICTSLVEARLLAGSPEQFERFQRRFEQMAARRHGPLLYAIQKARAEERGQYGETVYLLEPNVKRSRGGLRDIQLLRWIGLVRYGDREPEGLRLAGRLEPADHVLLQQTLSFLLRLRNEMHFEAGKSSDVLSRPEQLRIAETLGYHGEEGLLPVEQFMREYFRLTHATSSIVNRFVEGARPQSRIKRVLAPLVSHRFEGDYRVGPRSIGANRRGMKKLGDSLAEILRLADVANLYDLPIDYPAREAIRAAAARLPDDVSPEAAERFRSLLNQPARVGELLHELHDTGVLEKVIPAFGHARCLLQFNEYHKFTVDEHSLRAVQAATEFASLDNRLGHTYRRLKRKWLLHLALLIHDLGKGYAEDHSDVGRRIATDTAQRLRLAEREQIHLEFLVHKHLLMSHLTFRRDTSDEAVITRLAFDVGSLEMLQMLYVLTAADLAAVGPGVLNAWKMEVLTDVYRRTRERLSAEVQDDGGFSRADSQQKEARRQEVRDALGATADDAWFTQQVRHLPSGYLRSTPPSQIAEELTELHDLKPRRAIAKAHYRVESDALEYWVGTSELITPGVFHKLTGALSAQGLQILAAEIHTLDGGLVSDRFVVLDPDHTGMPPTERQEEVCRALASSLEAGDAQRPAFRRVWRAGRQESDALTALATQVRFDNATSDRYTIIDVFAPDRSGLLYTIARTLFELELSVAVAKIGTYLDQVVDVFYVTDSQQRKVEDERRLADIRGRLLGEIDAWLQQQAEQVRTW